MNPENKMKLAVFDMDGTFYKGFSQKMFIDFMAENNVTGIHSRKLFRVKTKKRMFQRKHPLCGPSWA